MVTTMEGNDFRVQASGQYLVEKNPLNGTLPIVNTAMALMRIGEPFEINGKNLKMIKYMDAFPDGGSNSYYSPAVLSYLKEMELLAEIGAGVVMFDYKTTGQIHISNGDHLEIGGIQTIDFSQSKVLPSQADMDAIISIVAKMPNQTQIDMARNLNSNGRQDTFDQVTSLVGKKVTTGKINREIKSVKSIAANYPEIKNWLDKISKLTLGKKDNEIINVDDEMKLPDGLNQILQLAKMDDTQRRKYLSSLINGLKNELSNIVGFKDSNCDRSIISGIEMDATPVQENTSVDLLDTTRHLVGKIKDTDYVKGKSDPTQVCEIAIQRICEVWINAARVQMKKVKEETDKSGATNLFDSFETMLNNPQISNREKCQLLTAGCTDKLQICTDELMGESTINYEFTKKIESVKLFGQTSLREIKPTVKISQRILL